jgi:hypothetical protein
MEATPIPVHREPAPGLPMPAPCAHEWEASGLYVFTVKRHQHVELDACRHCGLLRITPRLHELYEPGEKR